MTGYDPNGLMPIGQIHNCDFFYEFINNSPLPIFCFSTHYKIIYKNVSFVNFEVSFLFNCLTSLSDFTNYLDLLSQTEFFKSSFLSDPDCKSFSLELCAISQDSYKIIFQRLTGHKDCKFFMVKLVKLDALNINLEGIRDCHKNIIPEKQSSRFFLSCCGLSASQIANIFSVSENTVKNQIRDVKTKCEINSMSSYRLSCIKNGKLLKFVRMAMMLT